MPQKKEQYEGALESIFDFIFEEAKKPPSKVRPVHVKPTGVDTTSEMIDALGSVLANPLLFINEETKEAFKDALDIAPVQLKIGERGGSDTFKIKLSDIGDILDDPGDWADKQFKKLEAIRKMSRAAWAGEEIKGILGRRWASERGLGTEVERAMQGAGRKGGRTTGADYEYMSTRARDLGTKYFGGLTGSETKDDFTRKFGKNRGERMFNASKVWKKDPQEAVSREDVYYTLESQSLREKANDSLKSGDRDKAEEYIKASNFVVNSHDERVRKEYLNSQRRLLGTYSQRIDQLKGSSDPDKDQKIKEIKKSMNIIKSELSSSRLENWAGGIGKVEGMYYSVKNMYTGGNLLPSIINGNFFDDNYNAISWLQPSQKDKKIKIGKRELEFHAGKKTGNAMKDAYNSSMNAVYYMSPVTWARSLTNGEIFAYVGHVRREIFKTSDFTKGINGFNMQKFLEGLEDGDDTYLKSIAKKLTSDQMKKLKKFAKRDKRWGDLAYTFSTLSRAKKAIEDAIQKEIMKKFRDNVGKALLKVIKNQVASELIESWVAKGGIKVLVKALVTSVAAALGLIAAAPTGPVAPIVSKVIEVVTWVITEIIYQVGKVTIKFSLVLGRAVVFGMIGVFFLFGSLAFAFLGIFGKHSHVAPHEVVECEAYTPLGIIPIDIDQGQGPNCKIGIRMNTSTSPSKGVVIDILNRWVEACPAGGYPDECYEDVYCRALKYGIEPAFAITIWSNESGGSNYANNPQVEDFGIHGHSDVPVADFDKQIEFFLQNIAQPGYINGCTWDLSYQPPAGNTLSREAIMWGAKFLTGGCSTASQLESGYRYMQKISEIYVWYTGRGLTWPFTVPAQPNACDYSGTKINTAYHSCQTKGAQGWSPRPGDIIVEIPPFTPGNLPPGQECLFRSGPNLRCTQGPYSYCSKDPGYVNHYRPSHINSPAIDIAIGGNFNAPTFCDANLGNCKVVATGQGTCGSNNQYPAGGYVIFTAEHQGREYQFYILHVAVGVTPGERLGSGDPVATIVDSPAWRMCSSGLHAHLTVRVNGSYVDAQAAMNQDFQCNIGHCERDQCWPK